MSLVPPEPSQPHRPPEWTGGEPAPEAGERDSGVSEEMVFLRALAMTEEAREEYLRDMGDREPWLRERVEMLLEAHSAGSFMEGPVIEFPGAEIIPGEAEGDWIGGYRLVSLLGAGGFGTVWMAEQRPPLRRMVALKILKPGMETREVLARFAQERMAMALMEHPNIARVFDAGATPAGRPFIAMELVRGSTVTQFCAERRLPPQARLELFLQICGAVEHAHVKGVIHRDLKPSNVLVMEVDGRAEVKVIDFGVARAARPPEDGLASLCTRTGQILGTPLYMSPEQAGGGPTLADTRSDIFSLGVLLYELLTGTTPVEAGTLTEKGHDEVRRLIREEDPPRPSQRLRAAGRATAVSRSWRNLRSRCRPPERGNDLDWIVMRCLEKDPARRYQTCGALADDLGRHLRHEAVEARPPSASYLLRKMARRHRAFFTALGAVLAVLAAATVVSVSLAIRSRRAEAAEATLRRESEALRNEALLRAYEADMTSAALLHARGESGEAAALLDLYLPVAGRPDQRGFEWRYLRNEVRGEQAMILKGHGTMVSAVGFSRDGKWLASGDLDGRIQVWDAATGRPASVLKEAGSRVVGLSFSHDSRWLAAGGDKHLRIWSVPDFRLEREMESLPVCPVFSPAEPLLALGVNDNRWYGTSGETRLWRYLSDPEGKSMRVLPEAGTRIAFTADGQTIATGVGARKRVRVWSVADGAQKGEFPQDSAMSLALARDGSWLAGSTALPRDSPWIRRLPSGEAAASLENAGAGVSTLAASPAGNLLATGASSQGITLWDMTTGEKKETLNGHRKGISALDFSPDGKWLASGSLDETVRLWKVGGGRPPAELRTMRAELRMGSPRLSRDGRLMAACTGEGILKLYLTATLVEAGVIGMNRWPLEFSPDGRQLITLTAQGLLEAWSLSEGCPSLGGVPLAAAPNAESVSTLSPDGGTVAIGSDGGVLSFFNTADGGLLYRSENQGNLILGSAFSPDGRLHATVSQDGRAVLREVPSGRILHVLTGHKQDVRGVAFSPDGTLLATGGHDTNIKIWSTAAGAPVAQIGGHKQVVNFLGFSADGKTLVSAGDESELLLWHSGDWRPLGRFAIPAPVRSLTLSGDGGVLALSAHPGVVRLLRAPASEERAEAGGKRNGSDGEAAPVAGTGGGGDATVSAPFTAESRAVWGLPSGPWPRQPAAIPARDADTPRECLDLGPFYQFRLDESWTSNVSGTFASLSGLSPGVHSMDGRPWDIRGVLQVSSRLQRTRAARPVFPEKVTGIPLPAHASRLHFLGAAVWGSGSKSRPEAGRLVIHFQDGWRSVRPLVLGVDLLDWFDDFPEVTAETFPGKIVWKGSNENSAKRGAGLRMFTIVWENPRPESPLASLDFEAAEGSPFLTAITAEP